jgi:hypothetical protein
MTSPAHPDSPGEPRCRLPLLTAAESRPQKLLLIDRLTRSGRPHPSLSRRCCRRRSRLARPPRSNAFFFSFVDISPSFKLLSKHHIRNIMKRIRLLSTMVKTYELGPSMIWSNALMKQIEGIQINLGKKIIF